MGAVKAGEGGGEEEEGEEEGGGGGNPSTRPHDPPRDLEQAKAEEILATHYLISPLLLIVYGHFQDSFKILRESWNRKSPLLPSMSLLHHQMIPESF